MTLIASPSDIKRLGTILSIWAHPDDESFACAGIMTTAVQNGQTVACLTATKGEKGVQNARRWPPERLGDIRAEELAAALNVLGITNHHWLHYGDGECPEVLVDQAAAVIQGYINEYRPNTILTFGPEGMTGHTDHCSVSCWVERAVEKSAHKPDVYHAVITKESYNSSREADKKFNIFFNIDQPPVVEEETCDILFKLPNELLLKKYTAMYSMPSQYEAMFNDLGQDAICAMLSTEAFVLAKS